MGPWSNGSPALRLHRVGREVEVSQRPLRRILLVGDSARFARTLGTAPGLEEASIERTAGPADTLRRVRALPCDLVITDRSTAIAEDLALVEELRLLRP